MGSACGVMYGNASESFVNRNLGHHGALKWYLGLQSTMLRIKISLSLWRLQGIAINALIII